MANPVPDEVFARQLNQMGLVTVDQIEAAMREVVASRQTATPCTLADVLVRQGIITQSTRESVERKSVAAQQGGIKQLGPYKILKKLGEGGMGAVYLADDTSAGRKVALKVLPKKHAGDNSFLSRFRREAKATGQLNHVNIVAAYTTGEDMGVHYYAMEYCEGEPLDVILKREKHLAWDKSIEITLQVARGLKHAHEHSLIHRDIKPANVFITKDGVAKILDLGLSKNIDDAEQSFNTQTGVALGTPHYISPEQARGDKGIDGRTDIYSLGAMLYHLLTGETPFHGSTSAMIMMKHLTAQLPNPQDLNDNIPDGVVHVLKRMMAKEPDDRYKDCGALLKDLELVLDGKTPSSHSLDDGKSSIAGRQGLAPARRTTRGNQKLPGKKQDAGHHEPHTKESSRQNQEKKAPVNWALYGGVGGGVLVMVLVGVFAFGGGGKKKEEVAKPNAPTLPPPSVTKVESPPVAKVIEIPAHAGVEDPWVKSVQGLPAEELAKRVNEEMKRLNPGMPDCVIRIENARVTHFEAHADKIQTLAPVNALRDLIKLICHSPMTGAPLKSIAVLKGLKLKHVDIEGTSVSDLSPLQGMPVEHLNIRRTPVTDISVLKNFPLKNLITEDLKVDSIAVLEGKALTQLLLPKSQLADIAPIKSLRSLTDLHLQGSRVTSIEPLRYSEVSSLNITGCKISDLFSLRDMPKLSILVVDFEFKRDLELLRSLRGLTTINRVSKDEFFAKAAMSDPAKKDGAWAGAIDLKPLINPALDRVNGSGWSIEGGNLTGDSKRENICVIGMPYRMPEEYDLRSVVTRTSEAGSVYLVIPYGNGFSRVRLTNSVTFGDTTLTLKSSRTAIQSIPHECVVKVRKSGTQILFDEELLFDATAAQIQTLTPTGNSFMRDPGRLGVMIDAGVLAQVSRLQVREVTGRGVFIRPGDPAAVAAETARGGSAPLASPDDPALWTKAIDLIALVDLQKDVIGGPWVKNAGGLSIEQFAYSDLEFPYVPPPEYDLKVEFTMNSNNGFGILLARLDTVWRYHITMDKGTAFNMYDWLHQKTKCDMKVDLKRPHTCVIKIRNNRMSAYIDGKLCSDLETDYKDVTEIKNKRKDTRLLGLSVNMCNVSSVQLLEISGKGTFTRPGNVATTSPEKAQTPIEPASAQPSVASKSIDLLKLIDPGKDQVEGKWEMDGGALKGAGSNYARMAIPYVPPEEYDFRIRFVRPSAGQAVMQHIVHKNAQVCWLMGAFGNAVCCFEKVDGKLGRDHSSAYKLSLENGRVYESVVKVRRNGFQSYLDGKLVSECATNGSNLEVFDAWKMPDPKVLAIGCQTATVFQSIDVVEVTGKGRFLRPDDPAAVDAEKKRPVVSAAQGETPNAADAPDDPARWAKAIDILSQIDLQKDIAFEGKWGFQDGQLVTTMPTKLEASRLEFPYLPPAEYEIRSSFALPNGAPNLSFYVTRQGKDGVFKISDTPQGTMVGFEMVGMRPFNDKSNPSMKSIQPLVAGQTYDVIVQVNKKGARALINGSVVSEWVPEMGELSLTLAQRLRGQNRLGLRVAGSNAQFKSIDILEISGKGSFLRPLVTGAPKDTVKKATPAAATSSVTDAWVRAVRALPVDEQLKTVLAKLKELNPDFDGKPKHHVIYKKQITELYIESPDLIDISPVRVFDQLIKLQLAGSHTKPNRVSDLTPLAGMRSLNWLYMDWTDVSDLTPLKGIPLEYLQLSFCSRLRDISPLVGMKLNTLSIRNTRVENIAVLRGMPLKALSINGLPITDYSPLKDLPLQNLSIEYKRERDEALLRGMKTLTTIEGMSTAAFWAKNSGGGVLEAADAPERWAKALDLLKSIDPQKDRYLGNWRMENNALVVPKTNGISKLEIPYYPPEEYDFRIEFTSEGKNEIAQYGTRKAKAFSFMMGALTNKACGFEAVDGLALGDPGHPASMQMGLNVANRQVAIIQVRKDSVRAWLNGKLLCEVDPNKVALALDVPKVKNWSLKDERRLGVGVNTSKAVFDVIQVIEITGKGVFLRPTDAGAIEAEKKRLGM